MDEMLREQWWCFCCDKKYPKPTHEEGWHEDGSPAGVYYCPECVEIQKRYKNETLVR